MIVVVLLGLGLGKLAAVMLGGGGGFSQPSSAPSFTPLPTNAPTPTPSPSPKALPSPSASPSESPSPSASAATSPSPSPSPRASSKATPSASAKPTATPTARPTAKPSVIYITPQPKATVAPTAKPAPTATPTVAPALITGEASASHAASIVRSYIGALANGQESFAAGYLSRGLPTESFISAGSRITSIQSTQTGDGVFLVTAVIETAGGTYNESFTLKSSPTGLQITDHTPTKI